MPINSRTGLLKRRAVWATGVIAALAVAAPVAEASAQPIPALPLAGLGGLGGLGGIGGFPGYGGGFGGGFGGVPFGAVGAAVAKGPTVIGSVFNGGTTVVVSSGPAVGNTIASP
jgi:hypothetical protein